MNLQSIICGAAIVMAATAQVSYAQGQGRARGHVIPPRFIEMDTNRDGVITKAEWTGTAQSFLTHDWNRDGVISGDELRIGRGRGARANGDLGDIDSAYREYDFDDWTPQGFTGLDHNRDNRITRDEWHFSLESFQRADHDRNGWLSRAEFLSEDSVDDDREDRFGYLDANNDGRISRAEWHGATMVFNALDRNKDGFLIRSEIVGNEPPPDLFTSIDVNGDGSITVPEWHWSRQGFERRDGNKDGRLTQEEFRGNVTPDSNTAAYRAGYERGVSEGRNAGRDDRVVNHYWDLEGQRELETADSGYDARFGPKAQYQAGYREGFRRAYREGWERATTTTP